MTEGPWFMVTGRCYLCGRLFSFNPYLVPSMRVGPDGKPAVTGGGTREPICRDCATHANELLAEHGVSAQWNVTDAAYEPVEGDLPDD